MSDNMEPDAKPETALGLIKKIQSGQLNSGLLTKEQRQQCVEVLFLEGATSQSSLAELFQVTDKTIRRDLADIRAKNELHTSPEFVSQISGEFVIRARIHSTHLMKLARESKASVGERAQAEYYASMVYRDMISTLQSLGYLPRVTANILVTHSGSKDSISDKLQDMIKDADAMIGIESDQTRKQLLQNNKTQLELEMKNDNDNAGTQPA